MPRIAIKTPGRLPPARVAKPMDDEELDPTAPRGIIDRTAEFLSGRYANRKAKRRLQPPRDIAGRRG